MQVIIGILPAGLVMAGETPAPRMFRTSRHILEMIRFSHTVFALPFALLAAIMAWTTPVILHRSGPQIKQIYPPPFRWQDLGGLLICMVAARSAAMAFNRLADRSIDAQNPRTKIATCLPALFRSIAWCSSRFSPA